MTSHAAWWQLFAGWLAEHRFEERLFFSSLELAVLALGVALFVRLARPRAPRLEALLWTLVLSKPIVSLVAGSPHHLVELPVPAADSIRLAAMGFESFDPVALDDAHARQIGADPLRAQEQIASPVAGSAEQPVLVAKPTAPLAASSTGRSRIRWVLALWSLGVAGMVFRSARSRMQLARILRRAEQPSTELRARFDAAAARLGIRRAPRLLVTSALESPALLVLLRPAILVPRWLAERDDPRALEWSLRHELTHWKHGDAWLVRIRELAQVMFFFHPAAWWAGRRLEAAMEIACDRAVVTSKAEAADYARRLYQMLLLVRNRRRAPVACGLFATRTQIAQRFENLTRAPLRLRPGLSRWSWAGMATVSLAVFTFGGGLHRQLQAGDEPLPQIASAIAPIIKAHSEPAVALADSAPAAAIGAVDSAPPVRTPAGAQPEAVPTTSARAEVPEKPKTAGATARKTRPAPAGGKSALPQDGQLLADLESHNRLITQLIRAEVEDELREARVKLEQDPLAVEQRLKLTMERIVKAPELKADVRAQLRLKLEAAVREAHRRAATKDAVELERQQAKAANLDRQRVAAALSRDQEKLKQLMDRFDALMEEGRHRAADEIGQVEVPAVAHDAPIAASAALVAHATSARLTNLAQRAARQKAVIDTLAPVEAALVPFPDDQPVVYADASSWQELTLRRKTYARTDMRAVSPAEKKIREALDQDTAMDFDETPLSDAVDYLKDLHGIEIQFDRRALDEAAVGSDLPVTLHLKGISLRAALRHLLSPMQLTTVVKDEVLLITTQSQAETLLVTKAYPVADLVIPVRPIGGLTGGVGGAFSGGGTSGSGTGLPGSGSGIPGPSGSNQGPGVGPGLFNIPSAK